MHSVLIVALAGLLCGACQSGLSLSLGSLHCICCPSHWPVSLAAIVIAAILAGILLVIFLLLFNLTVAVGILNVIILYANILEIRNSSNILTSNFDVASLLVSFNLEASFDVCFFGGMDAFWKSLLQLCFPIYIFSLVILIILISEHSSKISNLIGKRNPVATLATLIQLSYTHTQCNSSKSYLPLSFVFLHYPDGSQQMVWLTDTSIDYLQGKH